MPRKSLACLIGHTDKLKGQSSSVPRKSFHLAKAGSPDISLVKIVQGNYYLSFSGGGTGGDPSSFGLCLVSLLEGTCFSNCCLGMAPTPPPALPTHLQALKREGGARIPQVLGHARICPLAFVLHTGRWILMLFSALLKLTVCPKQMNLHCFLQE